MVRRGAHLQKDRHLVRRDGEHRQGRGAQAGCGRRRGARVRRHLLVRHFVLFGVEALR